LEVQSAEFQASCVVFVVVWRVAQNRGKHQFCALGSTAKGAILHTLVQQLCNCRFYRWEAEDASPCSWDLT
jgi:hypothetical protein